MVLSFFFIIWIDLFYMYLYMWRYINGCLICLYLWPFIDSPYPSEGLEFLTLWCRMVNVSLSSWMVTMRDYPQPWLEVKDMHLWGRLIGAEQEGLKRGLFIIFLFRLQRCVDFTMSLCQACHAYKMHFMTVDIVAIFLSLLLCIQLRDHARCQ